MPETTYFPPEGLRPYRPLDRSDLQTALETGTILESTARRCSADYTLHFQLGSVTGIMPRQEAVAPWISGAEREISVISRVGKRTCFTVTGLEFDQNGNPLALLSRRSAQEKAMEYFLNGLEPGKILLCRVVRLESFGAFLDIGCGVIAMLPLDRISVSRISHSQDRFQVGQKIPAAVLHFDRQQRRITMTHRELLGTWMENASCFHAGETVSGIVRSVKEYGFFIELTPNLSGLADTNGQNLLPGDRVSVFIKSIRPEQMKLKLQIIEQLPPPNLCEPMQYRITAGRLERWVYSPPGCSKPSIETDFTASDP